MKALFGSYCEGWIKKGVTSKGGQLETSRRSGDNSADWFTTPKVRAEMRYDRCQ